jgi:uncharacterized protein
MMRIVADTNTAVSGLLWKGTPRRLINAARAGQVLLITSPPLLAELAEVLARNKFAGRIWEAKLSPRMLLDDYATLSDTIEPAELSEPVSRDPDDDEVIACALAAEVDAIVSGDGDLLTLGSHRGIPILTAAQALRMPSPKGVE